VRPGIPIPTKSSRTPSIRRAPGDLRPVITIAALTLLAFTRSPPAAEAQGITSGSVRGTVRSPEGVGLEGAGVRVVNTATGFAVSSRVFQERFLVQGLELGGPYVIEIRHIGFLPQRSRPFQLTLGEPLDLAFVLQPAPLQLESVEVLAAPAERVGHAAGTTIPESLVHQLPTLNRNFYDFVALAPQVSTKVGSGRTGVSAAGANLRFNSFLINGADERFVNGNVSAASNVGKSIPLDAVKEYQVLVAPYDVRFGEFAGAMVNTVTQSGTNEFRGSAFAYWRNDRLASNSIGTASSPYDRLQYGLSLGGPIVRNRVHFFVAPELQRLTRPAAGPYVGQPAGQSPSLPVKETDIARMEDIMRNRYGLPSGSGGYVENGTPLLNLFARVDASIPAWNSRATWFLTSVRTKDEQFSRSASDTFPLSTYQFTGDVGLLLTALRVDTDLPRARGGHNELLVSFSSDHADQVPSVRQPLVRVLVPGTSGGLVVLNAGSAEPAQGRFGRGRALRVRDDLSLPWGKDHVLVAGFQLERFEIRRGGVIGGYGNWTFASLDALDLGTALRFDLRKDFGSASTPLDGGQYGAYLGDEWRMGERLAVTFGARGDLLDLDGHAPYNPQVDSIFGRRTDQMPRARVHISPRLGFTWDLSTTRRERLRGGVGLFTGRPPPAWLVPAVANYGEGMGVLACGLLPTDAGPPPAFVPDYRTQPTQCATGPPIEAAPFGDVDLLDPDLRMAQVWRTSLAYERQLPGGLLGTAEVQVSRHRSDFIWVNLNLEGPQAVDRFGRVLYGTLGPNGIPQPALRSEFAEVIELSNTSSNASYQLAARLERRFAGGLGAVASYTYSRVRDVQSPSRVNFPGIVLWADARAVSGQHEDLKREISLNDLPHRIVAAVTYTAPWRRWPTELAFYYVGETGNPFTYIATGTSRRGDLNADGSNANDPIYVPRSALDTTEIRFEPFARAADTVTAAQQAGAFEQFVERTSCLRNARGRILERNGCREPWTHTTVASVRQGIPLGGRVLELELDAFNLLALLNGTWGRSRVARPRLLEHVGQTAGPPESSQPIFHFDPTRMEWELLPTESAFQLQVAARYRF
jgi:hypothetical protein